MKITVDLNTFTLGDLIDLEDAGGSLTDLQSARTIVALVWLVRRREDPTFTIEQAKATPVNELDIAIAGESTDPKDVESPKSVAAA